MIKAGIIGATGYTGEELVRLLSRHPRVKLEVLASHSFAGKKFSDIYRNLTGISDQVLVEQDNVACTQLCDVIFTALPHGLSMEAAQAAKAQGKVIIDLGADFRLDDHLIYEQWYKVEHTARQLLDEAVYGLPEVNREKIRTADIIANPGCYPTSSILGLSPLLKVGLAVENSIIIDSKSGVSGSGRAATDSTHYINVNNSFKAYKVAAHRHIPEIEQELSKLAGELVTVSFTPHLTPMSRGILSTIYVSLKQDISAAELLELYRQHYQREQFVKILPEGIFPETKNVFASNYCHIGLTVDSRTKRAIIVSVIDNLMKGASGQAIQNMNIRFGFEEGTAIDMPGLL